MERISLTSGSLLIRLIVVFSAPFMFVPFIFGTRDTTHVLELDEDIFLLPRVRESGTVCFGISAPFILLSIGEILSRKRSIDRGDDLGLSTFERLQFMCGTFGSSIVIFMPLSSSPQLKYITFNSINGVSALLMVASIVHFLNRSTAMWTDVRSVACVFFTSCSFVFNSTSFCFTSKPSIESYFRSASAVSALLGLIIFNSVCVACLRAHLRRHNGLIFKSIRFSIALLSSIESSEDLSFSRRALVPALHMGVTAFQFVAGASIVLYSAISPSKLSQASVAILLNWLVFFGAIQIIVIEYHLKQKLRQHLLFVVSATKKAYIRYFV